MLDSTMAVITTKCAATEAISHHRGQAELPGSVNDLRSRKHPAHALGGLGETLLVDREQIGRAHV